MYIEKVLYICLSLIIKNKKNIMIEQEKQTKINVLIDMLENYNNVKNDWYIEKIVKELRKTI